MREAFDFLIKNKGGDLLSVFHRDDIGDIDLVWGDKDKDMGLDHIINKHVGAGKDFETIEDAVEKISSVIDNGTIIQDGSLRYVVSEDGYRVGIRKDFDGVKKNWVVTAVDYNRTKKEKGITTNPTSASHGEEGSEPAVTRNSNGKVTNNSSSLQEETGKSSDLGATSSPEQIAEEENRVDTNPSDAQKEAGNYQKGHIKIDGLDISIENPKGSIRRGTDADGKQWESTMHNTYGYIRGTEATDGDHLDVFLSDDPASGNVFVVDQVDPKTGMFDEVKIMIGFTDAAEATKAYLSNYEKGWKGLGTITEVSREDLKKWIESSHRKTKPFADYAMVKKKGIVDDHKADGEALSPDSQEKALRDAVVEHLRSIGVEVSTDWQEGQRILDEYNGSVRKAG